MSELKKGSLTPRQYYDIGKIRETLGDTICENILFVHAFLGCDMTSRIFGISKGTGVKLLEESEIFARQALIFDKQESTKEEMIGAGDRAMGCIFRGRLSASLD